MRIYLLFGGRSVEHEVSVCSAVNVLNHMKTGELYAVYITPFGGWREPVRIRGRVTQRDLMARCTAPSTLGKVVGEMCAADSFVFPMLHGTYGEDGTVQGLLEMAGLPYAGCGVAASAAAMDKALMRAVFQEAGLPQTPYRVLRKGDDASAIAQALGYPLYVKPANGGSSVGVGRVPSPQELTQAVQAAFSYDERILLEREASGKEVILALLGNGAPRCSLPGVWEREAQFFSFQDKYEDASLTPRIPAFLSQPAYERLCDYARRAYLALDGAGLMRADFFVTADEDILINEVNTMPGFTPHSMYPLLWERSANLLLAQLLDELIRLGLQRRAQRGALCTRRREA